MKTAHDLDDMLTRYEREHEDPFAAVMGELTWRDSPDRVGKPIKSTPLEEAKRRVLVTELHKQGLSHTEIAQKIGAARRTVSEDLKILGLTSRVGKRQAKPGGKIYRDKAAERAAMAAEFEGGASIEDLATKYEITKGTVRERLQKAGVWHDTRRAPPAAKPLATVTGNALNEMAKFANLILEQDLSSVTLTEEEAHAWERACRMIGSSTAKARRHLKGNHQ